METQELIKFISERDDRLEKSLRDILASGLKNIASELTNAMLKSEQGMTSSLNTLNLEITNLKNQVEHLSNKTNKLFLLSDEVRDRYIPEIKANEERLNSLEKKCDSKCDDFGNLEDKIIDITGVLNANKNQKRGMLNVWSIIIAIFMFLVAFKELYQFFKK